MTDDSWVSPRVSTEARAPEHRLPLARAVPREHHHHAAGFREVICIPLEYFRYECYSPVEVETVSRRIVDEAPSAPAGYGAW